MQSTLEVGDEVILTSGVFGTINAIDDGTIRVEIADGVTIKVAQGAVGQVVSEAESDPAHEDPEAPEGPDAPDGEARTTEEN
jgi:preprotein translocase subunit YajC